MLCWYWSPGPVIRLAVRWLPCGCNCGCANFGAWSPRSAATSQQIELRAESDVKREPGKLYLPLLQCADCHTTGWLSRLPSGQSKLSTDLDEIYNTWFSGQPEALRLYSSAGLSRPLCDGIAQRVCTQCGHLQSGPGECVACGHSDLVDVFRVTANRTTTTSSRAFPILGTTRPVRHAAANSGRF